MKGRRGRRGFATQQILSAFLQAKLLAPPAGPHARLRLNLTGPLKGYLLLDSEGRYTTPTRTHSEALGGRRAYCRAVAGDSRAAGGGSNKSEPALISSPPAMSGGESVPAYVWIKLNKDAVFAYLSVEGAVVVGQVTALACKEFPRWRLDAGQVRLHPVTLVSGSEPSEEEIGAALAKQPLPVSAGVTSGAWLVAVPTPGAQASFIPVPS